MKKHIIIIITFFIYFVAFGQNIDDFKKEFKNAVENEFGESDFNELFSTYSYLILPHSDITQHSASIKNEQIYQYPLSEFKETDYYKNNIKTLLNSQNPSQRLLSYMVIAGAGDKSFENALLEKLKTEKIKVNLIWSGIALMYLQTNHTTPLFDFLIENENFGDSHMIPMYFQLNKDSLQNTAYNRINSKDLKAKVLSAQLLSKTGKNEKTEKLLLDAVKNWDYNIKGYAIYSVKELRISNLKNTFIPLLDSTQTRRIAIQALANSITKEDVDYLKELAKNENPISKDLLDGFYESKNIETIKFWLYLVSTKDIPKDYFFSTSDQPLLFSDDVLEDVQKTLRTTKHIEIQKYLIKVLSGRNDKGSKDIILTYLDNEDSSVRYWAVDALKGSQSNEVIGKLIILLEHPEKRVVSITSILIENRVDTLQTVYEKIYQNEKSLDWKRSSIEYLSNFPKENHKEIFLRILRNAKSDFAVKRDAARGLANLKDETSVDTIIKVCENERKNSDNNSRTYLVFFSRLKGEKAKKYFETYKNSKENNVRELANELLINWNK